MTCLSGSGYAPSWIQICQSRPSWPNAYCSHVIPSTTAGPASIAAVRALEFTRSVPHEKRSASGNSMSYLSSSTLASSPAVPGAATVA